MGQTTAPHDLVGEGVEECAVTVGARKAGAAGRAGDSIGTLVCSEFECSVNVRQRPPVAYIGFDVDAARAERIATLWERTIGFVREVLGVA
ncbi:FBP domain-containing protein [Rathayibacter agropyri]|nr:FBP domain-containing protein [Rathayibacter agropyri]NRD09757.1 FBP domain-containing protein [Rathayibacter agropyri]